MTHNPDPHILQLVGVIVGWLGICIGIYLQMVSQKVPFRYSMGFGVFGFIIISGHTLTAIGIGSAANQVATALKIIAYILIGLAEIYFATRLMKEYGVEGPASEMKESINGG